MPSRVDDTGQVDGIGHPSRAAPTRARGDSSSDQVRGSLTYAPVMSAADGNGPEDWSYLHRSQDFRRDMRWALFPWSLIRGLATWIRGKDPVEERRQARLAREQSESADHFADPEREAYRSLGGDRGRSMGDP